MHASLDIDLPIKNTYLFSLFIKLLLSINTPLYIAEKQERKFPTLHSSIFHCVLRTRLLNFESRLFDIGIALSSQVLACLRLCSLFAALLSLALGFPRFCSFLYQITLKRVLGDVKTHKNSHTSHRKGYSPTRNLSRNSEVVFYIVIVFIDIYTASVSTATSKRSSRFKQSCLRFRQ